MKSSIHQSKRDDMKSNMFFSFFAALLTGTLSASNVITYEEFGAVGDGKSDEQAAIIAAP
jgi:hypothetical protein